MDSAKALTALLLVATVAGCAAPDETPTMTGTESQSGTHGRSTHTSTVATPSLRTFTQTLYFTSDGRLDAALPSAGGVASSFGPTSLATGIDPATFLGVPVARAVQLQQDVKATLWIRADAPMPSNTAFDAGVWFGGTRATPLFGSALLPGPVVAPNTPTRLELNLQFGNLAPLVLAAGDSFKGVVVIGGDYGAGTSSILVGGDTPSSVNVTFTELATDPFSAGTNPEEKSFEGTLAAVGGGPSCAFAENVFNGPFEVRSNLTYLEAKLEGSGVLHADLDFSILDGDRVLSQGTTPRSIESMFLAGPAALELSGKTLTLRVVACSGGQDTFRAVVKQG